jgi:phosphopantothenoylcysteine decarboxylase/phosphopantothenate--cysteine ligase
MGHIRLSREADLVVVAPATADLLAKMAAGIADDLATTCCSPPTSACSPPRR